MVQARAKNDNKLKKTAITVSSFWDFELSSSPKIDRLMTISFFYIQRGMAGKFFSHALRISKIS